MARIKITGYLDTEELDAEHVDLDDKTGLSEAGYEAVTTYEGQPPYKIADLTDVEVELQK